MYHNAVRAEAFTLECPRPEEAVVFCSYVHLFHILKHSPPKYVCSIQILNCVLEEYVVFYPKHFACCAQNIGVLRGVSVFVCDECYCPFRL
jgi:hypothetical protein